MDTQRRYDRRLSFDANHICFTEKIYKLYLSLSRDCGNHVDVFRVFVFLLGVRKHYFS